MRGTPESINAVTIGCTDLEASHAFYSALGFDDVTMALGPGATEALKKHLAKANSKQEEPS